MTGVQTCALPIYPVADGYGVGTSIANAPVLNFALDIMEIEGKPMAKRGKWSGAKEVYRRHGTRETVVVQIEYQETVRQSGDERAARWAGIRRYACVKDAGAWSVGDGVSVDEVSAAVEGRMKRNMMKQPVRHKDQRVTLADQRL